MDIIPNLLVKFEDLCYSGQTTGFQKCTKLKLETKSMASVFSVFVTLCTVQKLLTIVKKKET